MTGFSRLNRIKLSEKGMGRSQIKVYRGWEFYLLVVNKLRNELKKSLNDLELYFDIICI